MPALTIEGIPDELYGRLKERTLTGREFAIESDTVLALATTSGRFACVS